MNKLLFEKILLTQSHSTSEQRMKSLILNEIKALNLTPIITDNYIKVSKGIGVKPCFMAHMDTVHKITKNYKVYSYEENGDIRYSSDTGIGGDDKNGIFICLELLKSQNNIDFIFFSKEEIGCIGSNNIELSEFIDNNILISLDRKDNSDIIMSYMNNDTVNPIIKEIIENIGKIYGYEENYGTITDSFTLYDRGVDISCINLSCGYYNPHTTSEYVSYNDIENCFNFCMKLCEELPAEILEHKKEKYYFTKDRWSDFDLFLCDICHTGRGILDTKYGFICDNCAIDIINDTYEEIY